MVILTMTDPDREETEKLIEDWNASRLDMFTMSKPDANLEFSGNMRFYFQESGTKDCKVSTKVLRVSSSDTTEDVMKVLVLKFHPDMKMLTMPNYSLYEVHETDAEALKLEMDQRPLYVQLYWQQYDRDGRFLLKSDEDQMTQKLFEDKESSKREKLDKRNSNIRKSGKKKNKNKKAGKDVDESKSGTAELFKDKPADVFTRTKSNPEAVMKRQREKKLEERLKRLQDPGTSGRGGGGGPLRIFAESLQPENPYKTILCASNDTTETVLKDALEKYEVPAKEMDQYCLTMVTIAPGSHSDPESSSGVQERIVPNNDCPAGIAAAWPESKGELRFYLKKKEHMPKRKQPGRRHDPKAAPRSTPTPAERSPPPAKETSFDVPEHSPTEKEPSSPAVHIVDTARDLPAVLEFRESGEDAFFAVVVSEVNGSAVNFKLAPTFTLYMCCRYRLSPQFRPDFSAAKRREKVMMTANKVANMMWQTVKENNGMAGHLAFWMANSSEFLHFLKEDVELCAMTDESQKTLAHTTQQAFRSLVQCIKAELQSCLPAFFDPSDESEQDEHGETEDEKFDPMQGYQSTERSFKVRQYGPHGQPLGGDQWMGKRKKTSSRPLLSDVLYTLNATMSLLRRCRVNPALTIQLFSQVFHFINMWLFNRVVLEPQLRLCTRSWGVKLRDRLEMLQVWAEKQGLELAAECHLGRISQAALLLEVPKQDPTAISSHCYKLNSLQLRQLLELYQPERDEPAISLELIENAVNVAENTADAIARSEGQEVRLEEEPDLHLPFLLPDDGYSSENIRGVPPGLKEFLDPLITPGLCRLTIQPKASGLWTVHFRMPVGLESHTSPEVLKISINKGEKGLGVSIVAAKGAGQEHYGIYVKEVIDGGQAAQDGRLKPGDQILEVNGESLVGVQQEGAVKILKEAGSVVHMTVAKKAVFHNGLAESILTKPPNNKNIDNRNLSPLPQKKETSPRAPPRYRPPQDSPQRSPPHNTSVQQLNASVQQKVESKPKPEPPPKRRNPYEKQHNGVEQAAPQQAKTVVEYKQDEVPGRKPVKVGVALPYANPQDIQRRQKEIQQRKVEDDRREQDNLEREKWEIERKKRQQEEEERIIREEQVRRDQEERQRMEKEQQERQRIEREQQERQRIERENQERLRLEEELQRREQQERQREQEERQRREREERQKREREESERKRREEWEERERERIEREESDRRRQEQERMEREQREKEEHEKRMAQERMQQEELDEMSRRERELEMMLEQKRREKEKRLKELERQIQEERDEAERMEQELMQRLNKERESRKDPRKSSTGNTQVVYVKRENDDTGHSRDTGLPREDMRPNRPADYGKRGPMPADENRNNPLIKNRSNHPDHARRPPLPNEGSYGSASKRPTMQDVKNDSFDLDPDEVERQFEQRLAQEVSGMSEVDGGMVKVIRVPVQQDNWEHRGNARNSEDRPRARVDWQREEEERSRKEQQWRREADEQLVRDYQQSESYRQPPSGTMAEPVAHKQGDWEKDEELRRQREEDDRLREARANQLRNRIIERPEDDDLPPYNGRTRRVKFASVRTEIIQPSPDAEATKPGVKFVHDGKVMDSDDEGPEEFPRPPPPVEEIDGPPPPLPPHEQDYYQRPPPPPKPQNLMNGVNPPGNPTEYRNYRDNEHAARARARLSDDGYATYPGRRQDNNNYPVPKPRSSASDAEFSPDQSKLPFNDKMKVFNETTPPKRQPMSKWEQRWANGDSL